MTNPAFHIRPAGPGDADAMISLGRSVAAQPLLVRYGVSPEVLGTELRRLALAMPEAGDLPAPGHTDSYLLLAEPAHSSGPCGFARFQRSGSLGPGAYLQLIALLPGTEGRGMGSALLLAVEAEAARGSPALLLLTADFNTPAQRFYQRHGYRLVGSLPDYVRPGIAELLFYKLLRDPGIAFPAARSSTPR